MVGDDLEKHPGCSAAACAARPRPTSARRTHGVRSSVLLSMLPLPPGGAPPGPAAAPLRPLLDREPVAAQDGPGQRAIAVLTLAFAPVKRAIPGVRLGPAGEAAFRPPASRGEGAEAQSEAKGTEAI